MPTIIEELTEKQRARKLARMLQDASDLSTQLGYQHQGAKLRDMEIDFLRRIADGTFDDKE